MNTKTQNMREIKFRAWTGEKMTDEIRLESAHGIRLVSSSDLAPHKMSDDKVIFMQFTGLHDKNGEEIYEGDIIKSRENDEVWCVDEMLPAHRHSHVTNIGYYSGKKYHPRENPAGQYDNMDDWMSWPEMYEIIGNIYENPELLTKII